MVHPNILHLLSQTHPSRSRTRSSSLPSSLSLPSSSVTRGILFFTPYSLMQHWNGFILCTASFPGDAELPSTGLRAIAPRAVFRSSRSPHNRNNFSRRVSRAVGVFRRLRIWFSDVSNSNHWALKCCLSKEGKLTPPLRDSVDLLHLDRLRRPQWSLFPVF